MTRTEMLRILRETLNEETINGIWVEATLLAYLAEGQDKFCEDTGFFVDISNFSLTMQTGVAVYAIPDRVIQVLNIWNGSTRLGKVLTGEVYDEDGWGWSASATGVPTRWRTDQTTGYIEVNPTPTADENGDVLTLQVWRYSRYDLAGDGPVPEGGGAAPVAEPEIPSRFHQAPIEWACYRAFMHHDMEAQDQVKAAEHLANFRAYVYDGKLALKRAHNHETRVSINPAYRT